LFRGVRSVSVFGFGGNEVLGFPDLGACWRNAGERNLILSVGLDFISEGVEKLEWGWYSLTSFMVL